MEDLRRSPKKAAARSQELIASPASSVSDNEVRLSNIPSCCFLSTHFAAVKAFPLKSKHALNLNKVVIKSE